MTEIQIGDTFVVGRHDFRPRPGHPGKMCCSVIPIPGRSMSFMCGQPAESPIHRVVEPEEASSPVPPVVTTELEGPFVHPMASDPGMDRFRTRAFFGVAPGGHVQALSCAIIPEITASPSSPERDGHQMTEWEREQAQRPAATTPRPPRAAGEVRHTIIGGPNGEPRGHLLELVRHGRTTNVEPDPDADWSGFHDDLKANVAAMSPRGSQPPRYFIEEAIEGFARAAVRNGVGSNYTIENMDNGGIIGGPQKDLARHIRDCIEAAGYIPPRGASGLPPMPATPPVDDRPVATQYEVNRHAEKQDVSYSDAWRYFEREGYDMSQVDAQYRDAPENDEPGWSEVRQ